MKKLATAPNKLINSTFRYISIINLKYSKVYIVDPQKKKLNYNTIHNIRKINIII